MTDADARKAVRKNLLHGVLPMLLMYLAMAGLFCEAQQLHGRGVRRIAEFRSFGLPRVWQLAAFFSFALSALAFNASLLVALPKLRDSFRWPPSTAPQMLFPRFARSRPWVRAGVALLAVGTVLLLFGFVR